VKYGLGGRTQILVVCKQSTNKSILTLRDEVQNGEAQVKAQCCIHLGLMWKFLEKYPFIFQSAHISSNKYLKLKM